MSNPCVLRACRRTLQSLPLYPPCPQLEVNPRLALVWVAKDESPVTAGAASRDEDDEDGDEEGEDKAAAAGDEEDGRALRLLLSCVWTLDQVQAEVLARLRAEAAVRFNGPGSPFEGFDSSKADGDARLWFCNPDGGTAEALGALSLGRGHGSSGSLAGDSGGNNGVEDQGGGASPKGGGTALHLAWSGCGDGWEVLLGVGGVSVEDFARDLTTVHLLVEQRQLLPPTVAEGGDWVKAFPRDGPWRRRLRKGDPLDARDRDGKWFESVVVETGPSAELFAPREGRKESGGGGSKAAKNRQAALRCKAGGRAVKVHFKAWGAKFDEIKHVELDGADLAPRYSHTPNWRAALAPGTLLEAKTGKVEASVVRAMEHYL